jgi:hypothetical protein
MRKVLRMAGIASALVIILVVSITSVAMAAGPNAGICPNPDCTNICPNPDCPGDGDQNQYERGQQNSQQGIFKYQHRACQAE